jgi:hypothetical protein
MAKTCPEHEGLMAQWRESSIRLQTLMNDQVAALMAADPSYPSFDEKVQRAKIADIAARRALYAHTDQHHCV